MATQHLVEAVTDHCAPLLVTYISVQIPAASDARLLKRPRTLSPRSGPLKSHHRQYQKRKSAGLCTATGCHQKSAARHTHCHRHLQLMSRQHKQRYAARAREALCVYCGDRPGFWGVRCVICRQKFADDPLPSAARKALRKYREAEALLQAERLQPETRFQARKLLASGTIKGDAAKALHSMPGSMMVDGGPMKR